MQGKSFLGEMRDAVRHFYRTGIRDEVSDASIQGYLRASSQIEDIWQQIDEKLAALISQGVAPWDAYAQLRYPLAFIRAARTYQVFVKELLAADAAFDPGSVGYLPRITFEQANALCYQIQPTLEYAIATLNDPSYTPNVQWPLVLGPQVDNEGGQCPVTHLQGMIGAAREVREWAAGLIAQYENAVHAAQGEIPTRVTEHITTLQRMLAQADSQLRFGTDLAGQVSLGQATPQVHMDTENTLWNALQNFFLLNQAVAMPEVLQPGRQGTFNPRQNPALRAYRDQRISPDDLWRFSAPNARNELRGTAFGTEEMNEMWQRMGGILSAGAQQYLDEVEAALSRGDIYTVAAMANCPFEPIYRTRRPVEIAGASVPADNEFHWNFHRGYVESTRRFGRTSGWQECNEDERPRWSSC